MAHQKLIECINRCEDEECFECDKAHVEDVNNCPCEKNCPCKSCIQNKTNNIIHFNFDINLVIILKIAGCPCEHFDCNLLNELADSCLELSQNENFQFCYEDLKQSQVECQNKCDVYECMEKCYKEFDSSLENCPCAPKCPCKLFNEIADDLKCIYFYIWLQLIVLVSFIIAMRFKAQIRVFWFYILTTPTI